MIITAGILSGCSLVATTGLTENEEELVAEYAAGVLMRYVGDTKGGFGNLKPTPVPIVAPPEEPETVNTDKADEMVPPMDENTTDDSLFDTETDDIQVPGGTGDDIKDTAIAEAIGIEGFEVAYTGYEIAEVYPESGEDALSFSMQATEGRKLLVMHFDVKNKTPEDRECNVLDCNVKFRAVINDSTRVNEQMTILLNDLKSYREMIGADESADTVLVFEVESSLAEQIGSLSLAVVRSDGELLFKLM